MTPFSQARFSYVKASVVALSAALTACAVEDDGSLVASTEQALHFPEMVMCGSIPLPEVTDNVPPPAPDLEEAESVRCRQATLTWRGSYDTHSLIDTYRIYQNGKVIAETHGTPEFLRGSLREYEVTGLSSSASYVFGVSAVDIYGHESEVAEFSSVTTPPSKSVLCTDRTPPSAPKGLALTHIPGFCRSFNLTSDKNSVDGQSGLLDYIVYRDGVKIDRTDTGTTGGERFGLVPEQTYSYWMTAVDRAGNESSRSNTVSYTVPDCSTTVAGGYIDTLVLAINLPGYQAPEMTMDEITTVVFGKDGVDEVSLGKAERSLAEKEVFKEPNASLAVDRKVLVHDEDSRVIESERAATTKGDHLFATPITALNPPNMKSFFQEVSYGRIVMRNVGVHGWIELDGPISSYCTEFNNSGDGANCNVGQIVADARELATSDFGFDPDTRVERTIAIINGQARNMAGAGILYLSDMSLGTAIHEYAHTFGVEHAAAWRGRNFSALVGATESLLVDSYDVPFGASLLMEYGDQYNRMGSSGIFHFSTFQKELLGALGQDQIAHAETDGSYVLDQVEFSSNGVKELRIPVVPGGDTKKGPFIIAEYRSGRGYDSTLNGEDEVFRGIQFRLVPGRYSGVPSDTVYMGAVTEESPVFSDWHRDVRYELVDDDGETATLHICGITPPPVNTF